MCYNGKKKQVEQGMQEFIKSLEIIEDKRQASKVRHKIQDVVFIVLMATLANADTWEEIWIFAKEHEEFLKEYIELPNGIPSHHYGGYEIIVVAADPNTRITASR